jgi:hypothetical protein
MTSMKISRLRDRSTLAGASRAGGGQGDLEVAFRRRFGHEPLSVPVWLPRTTADGSYLRPHLGGLTTKTGQLSLRCPDALFERGPRGALTGRCGFPAEFRRDWAQLFPHVPDQPEANRRTRWLWGAFEQLRAAWAATVPTDPVQQIDLRAAGQAPVPGPRPGQLDRPG